MSKEIWCFCDTFQEFYEIMDKSSNTKLCFNCCNGPHSYVTIYENKEYKIKIFGDYYSTKLPPKVYNIVKNHKPDIIFYDPEEEKIILAYEKTTTTPSGNANNQRLGRLIFCTELEIPYFHYQISNGMDISNNSYREISGPIKILNSVLKNKSDCKTSLLFFKNNDEFYEKLNIMWDFLFLGKYVLKKHTNNSFSKHKTSWKKKNNNDPLMLSMKKLFESDSGYTIYQNGMIGIFDSKDVEKYTDIKIDDKINNEVCIIPIQGFKKNGIYADPNVGDVEINSFLIREFSKDITICAYIFSPISTKENILSMNNKMTRALKKRVDFIILQNGDIISSKDISVKTPRDNRNKMGLSEDKISSMILFSDYYNENININYINTPCSSWSNPTNPRKRDEERADFLYNIDNIIIGGESKEKYTEILKCRNRTLKFCEEEKCDIILHLFEYNKNLKPPSDMLNNEVFAMFKEKEVFLYSKSEKINYIISNQFDKFLNVVSCKI